MRKDRYNKAKKILAIINHHQKMELHNKSCLDIGCSSGEITEYLGDFFNKIYGIDIDKVAIFENSYNRKYKYIMGNSSRIPFSENKFDIIICSQVYEHVESQIDLVNEIKRLLKPRGICFFSGPNKYSLIEEHYWLPLLSWFPKKISNLYMRIFNKGRIYDPNPLSYKNLLVLLNEFIIFDYTKTLIKNPQEFFLSEFRMFFVLSKLPDFFLKILLLVTPNFNFILEKKDV